MKRNSIEKRIELTVQSIDRNKDRKQRREKAEAKLNKLLQLKEELERKEAERKRRKAEKAEKKRERGRQRYWETHTPVYHTNGRVEREAREEDLYTLEELFNPPEEETGRINKEVWDRLVNEVRVMQSN